jgi:DNA ligase-1
MTTTLPVLYKKSPATGALLEWCIAVEDSTLVSRHGQVGGAIQESRDTIKEGKNLGKKNATTAAQQAELEAEAKHRKQRERNGYTDDRVKAEAGGSDQEGGVAPMLAHPYDKIKKPKWPYDVQRKYDGLRCIAVCEGTDVTLWSRKRAPIVGVPHVVEAVSRIAAGRSMILDGELYASGISFQTIASFVRQQTEPKPGHEVIEYHVYDVPSHDGPWSSRRHFLEEFIPNDPVVRRVETVTAMSYEDAKVLHDQWVQEGYEGAILRGRDAVYEEGKRSRDLIKLKEFQDDEAAVVSVREGRGKFAGCAVFTCDFGDGKLFECTAPGPLAEKASYLRDESLWRGRRLTVKYFGKSDEGIARFPVAKAFRDVD